MIWLEHMAAWHLLLWLVPGVSALLLAAIGGRLALPWIWLLSVVGVGWTTLQSALVGWFYLQGTPLPDRYPIALPWAAVPDLSGWSFAIDGTRAWAVFLASVLCLAAQTVALQWVVHRAGRHRFHALVLGVAASAAFLFTSRLDLRVLPIGFLVGWEGIALTTGALTGFWAEEQRGMRPGVRWILFQRLSGVLLLTGLLVWRRDPQSGAYLLLLAAGVRAGLLMLHGWVPSTMDGPLPVPLLVQGAASILSSVFLIEASWDALGQAGVSPDAVSLVGLLGALLGTLAGLQPQAPQKAVGWLFIAHSGLVFLAYGQGDPVAARWIVTGAVLTLSGLLLVVKWAADEQGAESGQGTMGGGLGKKWFYFGLAALLLPPSMEFLGLGRLLGGTRMDSRGTIVRLVVIAAAWAMGWIIRRLMHDLSDEKPSGSGPLRRMVRLVPVVLWSLSFILGASSLFFHGDEVIGGRSGAIWAGTCSLAGVLGWILSSLFHRGRRRRMFGRLTFAQRVMEYLADTGLGIGEVLVQIPLVVAQALGVLIWRVLGDFLIDTLIIGTTVRTIEGVGMTLRFLQNGYAQRYLLVVVLGTLCLMLLMLR